MQTSLKSRFVENLIYRPASRSSYGNNFKIPDPSRESLRKDVQEPRRPKKIAICPLWGGITGMLQLLSSLVSCKRPQEP
ncbi:hypothetical protein TNCV_2006281 [Trichonephila clavipes]|nr:hypothetical protein TNCV_2006281 [Trichonephila clavipes]